MRKFSRQAQVLVLASTLVLAVSGCKSSSSTGAAAGGGTVKVGFMGDLTGANKQLGINIHNGAKLAFDQYNATNPANKIEFTDYDTQGKAEQATAVAPKVISDKMVAVIGPAFSGESKTAVPILEEGKIPNISASATNALLSKNGWKFWHRVLANDDVQGPGAASFLVKNAGFKKIAVIDDQSEYGKGLAKAVSAGVTADGGTVAVTDSIDPKADAWSSTVNKVKGANVDAIYFAGYYSAAAPLVKQFKDAGVTATFASGDGTLDQAFITGAGAAAEGAILTCTCVLATSSTDPAVSKFISDYKAAFNGDPATYSAEGFDAGTAIVKAVQAGKTSAVDINTFLATEDFKGVSKPIKWDAAGELTGGGTYIHRVKGGKIEALGNFQDAKL
ncbi:MAG: branched-chain amino acid transport system substrate-binding protein [Frankiaceae bacterium]|jgi:branched-chain amino acid transport system substrate-binding protein|nr:branched-chain amino acid transport system substrate-binding protein [Frankiaceae bacterium]